MKKELIESSSLTTRDYVLLNNDLATGRGEFSACMLDVLFYILANLQKDELSYRVNALDIEKITGRQWNYQQFKDSTETLGSRMFEIETDSTYTQLWLFSSVKYLKGEGAFEIRLGEAAIPHLFNLKGSFSEIQLKSLLTCSSKHAKRIYMMCCKYRNLRKKKEVLTISSLKEMLGLKDPKGKRKEQYKEITALKAKVLDVAKMQINEYSDINFEYKLHKKGRSYYWVEIFINRKATEQLEINFKINIEDNKLYSDIKNSGITEPEHIEFIAKQGRQSFERTKKSALNKLMNMKNNKVSDMSEVCDLIINHYRKLNPNM